MAKTMRHLLIAVTSLNYWLICPGAKDRGIMVNSVYVSYTGKNIAIIFLGYIERGFLCVG